jgi:ATP-dependent DNA helicase RecG
MSPGEKEAAMEEFRKGQLQVLVATTVIEVGIDVPNASVMVIASPERFGLAQMHQLRGRVGRGTHPGYCGLLADQDAESPARERLSAFASISNGFELAELDFAMRGPGDLFGTQQHGLPPLRVANLVHDRELLVHAREVATQLYAADPGLALPEHERLRRQMLSRYGSALELGDVG